jgi:hypothetical protein
MSDYFYSARYLNDNFGSTLIQDLDKDSICYEIEKETNHETSFVTITGVNEESNSLEVDYRYSMFGESEEGSCTLDLRECYKD